MVRSSAIIQARLQNDNDVIFYVTLSPLNSNLNRNPYFNLRSESLNKVAES